MQHDDVYGMDRYPWEKLPDETDKQYAGFLSYRDMGRRRTLREAAAKHYGVPSEQFDPKGGKARTFERWSGMNRWVKRAEAWDDHLDRLSDADTEKAILDMKQRHAQIAVVAQAKVVDALNSIDVSRLNLLQIAQVFDLAVKNERLARGVPASVDAIVSRDDSPQLQEAISDEALLGKIAAWRASRDPANTIEAGEPQPEEEGD